MGTVERMGRGKSAAGTARRGPAWHGRGSARARGGFFACLLVLGATACGLDGSGEVGISVVGDGSPPSGGASLITASFGSSDPLDGTVTSLGTVIPDGLAVGIVPGERDYGFLSFDLLAIPVGAILSRAELAIYAFDVSPYGGAVSISVDRTDLGPYLDAWDPLAVRLSSVSLAVPGWASGMVVSVDATPLVGDCFAGGCAALDLRLVGSGGFALFDDGDGALGSGWRATLTIDYWI